MPFGNRFAPDRERPSVAPVLLRVLLLAGILVIVIVFQQELGQGATNCMRAFGMR